MGASELLSIILEYLTADRAVPPQRELARILGVQPRTIERWVKELREKNYVHSRQGKKGLNFRSCHVDTIGSWIGSSEPNYRSKLPIVSFRHDRKLDRSRTPQTPETSDPTSDPRAMGGGILSNHADSVETPTPPTPPRLPQTGTGRWLVGMGFWPSVAAELEAGPLAGIPYETVRADYERLCDMGKRHGAIVQHWRAVGIVVAETAHTRSPWSREAAAWREWTSTQRPARDSVTITDEQGEQQLGEL